MWKKGDLLADKLRFLYNNLTKTSELNNSMADSVRASKRGLEIVNEARYHKGWKKQVTVQWWEIAHTSQATLKRFWQRKPIDRLAFIAICRAVGVDWEEVVERDEILEKPQTREAIALSSDSKSELLTAIGSYIMLNAARNYFCSMRKFCEEVKLLPETPLNIRNCSYQG